MDPDPMRSGTDDAADGWTLLVAEPRRHVKALTRELRTSPDRAAQSRAAQIDPYLAYGIDWRRGDGEEEVFLVLSNEGVLHTLRSSTGTFSRTSDEEANR